MVQRQCRNGVHEFVFGALVTERAELLDFWSVLGFEVAAEGQLEAAAAGKLFDHASNLTSVRLRHKGCDTYETGLVRLQFWDALRNEGFTDQPPIVCGSRWMGMYTQDILQLRDSLTNAALMQAWQLWVSPLVNAPLAHPAPEPTLSQPFVGLRETLVFGRRIRLAFIQRGGFDRPGFGTFDSNSAFKNTEGSHASLVQPSNAFSTDFYKAAFDFETAPFGEPHDSGTEPPTIEALQLKADETFHIERTRAKDCPSGLLQVYSSYLDNDDCRDRSAPGCGNLCAYSVRVRNLEKLAAFVESASGASHGGIKVDEFGEATLNFTAPDGLAWIAIADVA